MKPIGPYLVVEPKVGSTQKRESGLEMTMKQAQVRYREGTVVAVSDAYEELKVGDNILYHEPNAHEVMVEGKTHTIMMLRDVVMKY